MSGTIFWNGDPVHFRPGETLAQALNRAGVASFGRREPGADRAVFCGIGQCQGCLVHVTSRGLREACLEPCHDGLEAHPITGGGYE